MCSITSALEVTREEKHALEKKARKEKEQDCHQQEGERSLIMSLHDVVHPRSSPPTPPPQPLHDQFSSPLLDEISSPISAQIFDFCDSDMFPESLQNSEATSSPNCCCYEDHNSSYATNISFPSNVIDTNDNNIGNNKFSTQPLEICNFQGDPNDKNGNNSTTSSTTTTATTTIPTDPSHHHSGGFSIIFNSPDEIDNDISAAIDFSPSPPFSAPPPPYNLNPTTAATTTTQQDHYQLSLAEVAMMSNALSPYPTTVESIALPLMGAPPTALGTVFEEDCLSPIPPFLRLNPNSAAASTSSSSSFLDPSMGSFLPGNYLNLGLGADNSGLFAGNLFMTPDLHARELDFQGDNSGIFCPDQLPTVYNSGDMQGFSNESSQLVSAATSSGPLATEISSLEDSTFKVGKLSAEQRKEKIHRYLKKRNERNFSKKIKYACRKTLADSRPRVRGRFAKNDDYGENPRHISGHYEDEDYQELQVAVKEEDDLMDSSDIFSHISGVNSFKCNYQIQSWI